MKKLFKNIDWDAVRLAGLGLAFVTAMTVIPIMASCDSKDKLPEEKIRAEEFTYKGHRYIKFKGHDLFGTGSVVHDPDCRCHQKE